MTTSFPRMDLKHGEARRLEAVRRNGSGETGAEIAAKRARRVESDLPKHLDSAGRYADFHSLRGQYIGRVVQAGANLKEAMELARHSDPKLTMKTYARVRLNDLSAVLERLPLSSPAAPSPATGTFGKM